jgi:hypothetical protein
MANLAKHVTNQSHNALVNETHFQFTAHLYFSNATMKESFIEIQTSLAQSMHMK